MNLTLRRNPRTPLTLTLTLTLNPCTPGPSHASWRRENPSDPRSQRVTQARKLLIPDREREREREREMSGLRLISGLGLIPKERSFRSEHVGGLRVALRRGDGLHTSWSVMSDVLDAFSSALCARGRGKGLEV